MTTVTYLIPNISCHHCVHTVQNEVGEIEGVVEVKADLDSKTATIVFNPPADENKIKSLLAQIDYPVAS